MDAALYNARILRLAASIPHGARLEQPDASVERRSPVCGSRVTADVRLGPDGRIIAFGQLVRACALGQASAAIMAGNVIGRTGGELADAADALAGWLKGDAPLPALLQGGWPELALFAPARAYAARHPSILLAFQAAAAAAEAAALKGAGGAALKGAGGADAAALTGAV